MKKTWVIPILILIATLFTVAPLVASAATEEGTTNIELEINAKEKEIGIKTSTLNQFLDEIS